MRYQGGKSRIANEISEVLTNAIYGRQVSGIDRACEPAEYIYIYIYMRSLLSACSAVLAALRARLKQRRKSLTTNTST